MKLTTQQRLHLNNMLQEYFEDNIMLFQEEMLDHALQYTKWSEEYGLGENELREILGMEYSFYNKLTNKEFEGLSGRPSSTIASEASGDFLEFYDAYINDPRRDIQKMRHMIRRMRDFKDFDGLEDGYYQALEDMLSLTKKMLQDHETKWYYQFKSCLKCHFPFNRKCGNKHCKNTFRIAGSEPGHRGAVCSNEKDCGKVLYCEECEAPEEEPDDRISRNY